MSEDWDHDFRQYPPRSRESLPQPGVRVVLLPEGDTATGDVRVAKAAGTDDQSGSTGDVPATARDVLEGGEANSPSGTEDFPRVVAAMEARGWMCIGASEDGMSFFAMAPSGTEGGS